MELTGDIETFLKRLFEAHGFTVETDGSHLDQGFDLKLRAPSGRASVVEIKLYRTKRVDFDTLSRAISQVEIFAAQAGVHDGVLVITSQLSRTDRMTADVAAPNVLVLDHDALTGLAAVSEPLALELQKILRDVLIAPITIDPSNPILVNTLAQIKKPLLGAQVRTPPRARNNRGELLCQELDAISTGKPGWKQFEAKATEALKYAFEGHIAQWRAQKSTTTALHRFDLIGRIVSSHEYWKTLAADFQSRYVVFEFKNDTYRIKQGHIHSTEKYLFRTALRSIAVIVCRTGTDKNADAAIRGAIRESGKLIVSITTNQLCKMLKMKDVGDDPTNEVMDLIDQFMMSLER